MELSSISGWAGLVNECKWCKRVNGEDMSENALQLISTITEFNNIHDFMNDEQLDRAMELVIKLMGKRGEISPQKAVPLIVELQALSTKFALASAQYATFDSGAARSVNAHKKNVYYSAKEAINKLVDALKFSVKLGLDY